MAAPRRKPSGDEGRAFQMSEIENSMIEVSAERQHSSPSPNGRAILLWSKSHVYIHPTPRARDNICGYLGLVSQGPPNKQSNSRGENVLLAWIPNSVLSRNPTDMKAYEPINFQNEAFQSKSVSENEPTGPYQYVDMPPLDAEYAFSIPLGAIYSIMFRPPRAGWSHGSIVINKRGGDSSFPALFFHDNECPSTLAMSKSKSKSFDPFGEEGGVFWGGDHLLSYIKTLTKVERSSLDKTVYLFNPDLSDSYNFRAQSVASKPTIKPNAPASSWPKTLKDARWAVLERFSRITQFGRKTANDILEHPITVNEILPRMPPRFRQMVENKEIQKLAEEYDPARVYLAKWAAGIAQQSARDKNEGFSEMSLVGELGEWEEDSVLGMFEVLSAAEKAERRDPLNKTQWNSFFDKAGYLSVTVGEVKDTVFHGGIEPSIRKEVWMFFLGVYDWHSSSEERSVSLASKRDEYYRLKKLWYDDVERQRNDSYFLDQKSRIEKDVHRTDRSHPKFAEEDLPHPDGEDSLFTGTNIHMEMCKDILLTYNEYNKDLGYVQGMSDLLAPIYVVMEDDAASFWALCGFMDRMQVNFLRDQSGMRRQLLTLAQLVELMDPQLYRHLDKADSLNFFCFFRMLLVWFKREFSFGDVLRLWEVLFTDHLSSNFQIFIALSILEEHKPFIMENLHQFDEVLKYFNDLSMTIDLESTLVRAELLFHRFRQIVQSIDRKNEELDKTRSAGLRHRRTTPSSEQTPQTSVGKGETEEEPERKYPVITEYLRGLLQ